MHRQVSEGNEVSSALFSLLFGVLSGAAGFLRNVSAFEMVLTLGLIGLMHLTVVAGRQSNGKIVREDIPR